MTGAVICAPQQISLLPACYFHISHFLATGAFHNTDKTGAVIFGTTTLPEPDIAAAGFLIQYRTFYIGDYHQRFPHEQIKTGAVICVHHNTTKRQRWILSPSSLVTAFDCVI